MDIDNKNNPIWNVYDNLRTIALNEKYYSERIVSKEKIALYLDISIALFTSSAIAKFPIWETQIGSVIWPIVGGIAVILSIIRPFLKLSDKIKKIDTVLTQYRLFKHEYEILRIEISEQKKYTESIKENFHILLEKEKELLINDPENKKHKKLINKCQAAVLKEYPADSFFIPEEE
jgi:hypothetical protein